MITITDLFAGAPTIGSLCSGYGGLDRAVEQHFGAVTRWFCEFEEAPSRVLEAHWPGVPNHGDMTRIDWAAVEPVDIICGGTPCQDLSAAGRRKGMTDGTRSNLWVQMREAIATIRPKVVIWENVRGALSAYAASEMESEPGLLGEPYGPGRPALRAIGRVYGDLSELGYRAAGVLVRASDAGAPHARARVFVVAVSADAERGGWERRGPVQLHRASVDASGDDSRTADADAEDVRHERGGSTRGRRAGSSVDRGAAADTAGCGRDGRAQDPVGEPFERALAARGGDRAVEWGAYEPAIRRWERVLGRVAPAPTNPDGKGGVHRLAPEFVEWMMGALEGWVTGVPGITRNQMLKMLGNGVVTQQALLAIGIAWARLADVREAVAA